MFSFGLKAESRQRIWFEIERVAVDEIFFFSSFATRGSKIRPVLGTPPRWFFPGLTDGIRIRKIGQESLSMTIALLSFCCKMNPKARV